MSQLLIRSRALEELDLAYNDIKAASMFCLAEGLALNESLINVSLEGNPLGAQGLNFLMKAKTRNTENTFNVNIKLAEAEADSLLDENLFDTDCPENSYDLDLSQEYDFFVL